MWLFTKLGFYSVVCARLDGGHGRPDPTRLMIRSRRVSWLTRLQDEFPDVLGVLPIHRSPKADYAARIFVDKQVWSEQVMPKLGLMIDYDNFKGELTRTKQHEYHDACSSVWAVMHRLQSRGTVTSEPRSSAVREPSTNGSRFWPVNPKTSPLPPLPEDLYTTVVVVGQWTAGRTVDFLYVLTDVDQYKRSRVAVRDAASRGWAPAIVRSSLSLQRLSASEANRRYPTLKRVSMKGVVPSVGVLDGHAPKTETTQ